MNNYGYGRFNGPAKHVAPKPKGKIRLFLELWWENFWSLIPLNAVYSMLSLLLIPYGFASAGFTNVTRNLARDKHTYGFSDFIETAKKNWKQALIVGLINVVLMAVMIFGIWFYAVSQGIIPQIGLGVCIIAFAVFSMMKYYIWVLMITFDLSIKALYRNSFYFVLLNIKNNLIIGSVCVAYYALLVLIVMLLPYRATLAVEFLLTVMLFPGFKHLLVQYLVFPSVKKHMIDPYYEEHPDEDVEKRKDLHV